MASNRALSLVEAKRRIAAVEVAYAAGHPPSDSRVDQTQESAYHVAARALRIPRTTLVSSLEIIKRRYGLEPDRSKWTPPEVTTDAIPVLEPEWLRDRRRLTDRVESLGKQLREAHRQANADDDLRQAVFGLAAQKIEPPKWTITPPTAKASSASIPLLFTSDFQWGETIRSDDMAGINEFNIEVAARRYRLLIEKTIDLSFNHMVKPDYPGIIYVRGGDMVSGEIHEELARTNELSAIPAVNDLVDKEAWGIERIAEKFGRVYVVTIPGNHGRSTVKPHSKRYAASNYDTLSGWMLEKWFRNDGRIEFHTPMSGDAMIEIFGWRVLVTHGDRMGSRGGQGFIGPAATIARGMKKVVDYYATLGQTIDVIMVGHFHTPLELEHGFSNGSLPGASEYARDGRMRPAPPTQWLLFFHPDHGVTARWPILLEKPMRRPSGGPPVKVRGI